MFQLGEFIIFFFYPGHKTSSFQHLDIPILCFNNFIWKYIILLNLSGSWNIKPLPFCYFHKLIFFAALCCQFIFFARQSILAFHDSQDSQIWWVNKKVKAKGNAWQALPPLNKSYKMFSNWAPGWELRNKRRFHTCLQVLNPHTFPQPLILLGFYCSNGEKVDDVTILCNWCQLSQTFIF